MKTMQKPNRDTYRLIVARRGASEILLESNGLDLSLPSVEVHPERRLAYQLVAELNRQWNVPGYCLFIPGLVSCGKRTRDKFALLESIHDNTEPPPGTRWLPTAAPECKRILPAQDGVALSEALRELDSYVCRSKPGPFARPGWLKELFNWSQQQLNGFGLRLTSEFCQFNATPTFSLIRLETTGPSVWFKAVGEPNLQELPITLLLSKLFPGNLPAILGVHESWNAWLSEGVADSTLDQSRELSAWECAASNLAQLQIGSIGKNCQLLDAQSRDLRLARLIHLIPSFIARMSEFMAVQTSQTPATLTDAELSWLENRLLEACSLLGDLQLPDTLGNVDFNPGNILVSAPRCHFLDWAEACVTNPLVTFEYLREHAQRSFANDATAIRKILASYCRPWQSLLSPDVMDQALSVSSLVAIFVYGVSGNTWSSVETVGNPRLAGYFRSLTRQMYREAMDRPQRRERCFV